MRLVFFGTPEFASRCLETILSSKHQVAAVVTAPDKPQGRGMKLESSSVKRLAQMKSLPILQPENLRDQSFIGRLRSIQGDLFCVVAFRILPEEVFSLPPHGCLNLHASLLPKYRGAAPINWALINGENETGLTTFFIQCKVDTGDIILQEKIEIGPDETFGELHDRMAEAGASLLLKTVDLIESGGYRTTHQNDSEATPAPKLTPDLGRINWEQPAQKIHNLVRGLSPKPGAYSYREGKKIMILRTHLASTDTFSSRPGMVTAADPQKGIIVACDKGALELLELKPESGKAMSGAEYVRGYRLKAGESLGEPVAV